MRFMMRASLCVCMVFGALITSAGATTVDIPTAKRLSDELIAAKQYRAALEILTRLHERAPDDPELLIQLSRAHRGLSAFDTANAHGRRAYENAETPTQKFLAARVTAQALSSDDKKTRAQLWLRRAIQNAPNDSARHIAMRDYRYLRQANPWSLNLRFGISPTDNINNAPTVNSMQIGSLIFVDPTAVALTGTRVSAGLTARRNFNISPNRRDYLSLFWDQSIAHISSSERSKVPSVDPSDFDYRNIGFELGRDFVKGPGKPRNTLALRTSRSHYGGDPYANEVRLRFQQHHRLQDGKHFVWSGFVAHSAREDLASRSANIVGGTAHYVLPTSSGGRVDLFSGLETHASDSAAVDHDQIFLGARWTLAKPILGAEMTFGAVGTLRSFSQPLFSPEPREDTSLSLSASFFFRDLDAYGFAPKVTVTADRTKSNVRAFDTEKVGLSLAMESVF